jgi:O-antigen ligase
LLLGLLWLLAPQTQKDRLRTLWNSEAGPENARLSAEGRVYGLLAGVQMFEDSPVTGVGIGNFLEYRVQVLDGVPKIAHSLPGELLGEVGLIGALAFVLFVGTTWSNSRQVERMLAAESDATSRTLSGLAVACRNVLILMLFEGLALHNAFRFNWLWVAAFCALTLVFARQHLHSKDAREERSLAV